MFQHVLERQPTVYKSKRSTATITVNISADMNDNRDDERLLNQALDSNQQQQQQQTTTIPR